MSAEELIKALSTERVEEIMEAINKSEIKSGDDKEKILTALKIIVSAYDEYDGVMNLSDSRLTVLKMNPTEMHSVVTIALLVMFG